MPEVLDPVDVVCVGVGWTGGIIGKELAEDGKQVVGIERGQERGPEDYLTMHNELRYALRYEMMQDLSKGTLTFRNNPNQKALPMRQLGSFLPGKGVGGAGVHWNGQTWRFLPYDFQIRSETLDRYGPEKIPEDMQLQDWGITYEELRPYYLQFEKMTGISGAAGNLEGEIQDEGNPFEGPRNEEYPTQPMITSPVLGRFMEASSSVGLHPFMAPSANLSEPYTNPDGVARGPCQYCGYCERFGCEWGAKADPTVTVLPVAQETGSFELRTQCDARRLIYDENEGRVTGVKYVDTVDNTVYIQPAEVVALTAYILWNVKLLLLSNIGEPYDPKTGEGTVGKNYCYQNFGGSAAGFFDEEEWNLYMGAGALGAAVDDWNGDNFDHTGLDFLHGGNIAISQTGKRPIANNDAPPGVDKEWGAEFKRASVKYHNSTVNISAQGAVLPHRTNYLDLDPTYTDEWGDPLLRMTFDWTEQDRKLAAFEGQRCAEIIEAMNPTKMGVGTEVIGENGHYDIRPYQSTHNTGGAIMGSNPNDSVVNSYLQCWDAENLFIPGASAFPHNSGYNPTGTVGALAYRAADGIKQYFKRPRTLG
ncbi:GMC family oxidoreductase [Haladaptatus halobius]|jgi:gluconate 2-dehydrogenase alpha chain|uniref:GMC family oxidoreductase n=1 Tax=Haladaptatus halobius TaxID=2884875 RepID=UPI001D0B48CA|nr:GMC family oxidoreductase [Haladaptatus halobius]